MKSVLRNLIAISSLILLVKCDEDEVSPRNYPRLKTLPVTEITAEGARFNAEFIFRSDFEIVSYGFAWGEDKNPTKESSERIFLGENIEANGFSETIETTLKEETSYFVRAFVETDDFVVYGENIPFISLGSKPPTLLSASPLVGTVGDTIYISGKDLSFVNRSNQIFFNDVRADVLSSTDSTIIATIPEIISTENTISINLAGKLDILSSLFVGTSPRIDSVHPRLTSFGELIEINGDFFSYVNEANKVTIGNARADVTNSSKKTINVRIPNDLEESSNQISLSLGGKEVFFDSIKIKSPVILSINPQVISQNTDSLFITGESFNPIIAKNSVLLGTWQSEIIFSSSNQLIVKPPEGLVSEKHLSTPDTLDVKVQVLDQSFKLEKSLVTSYEVE